MKTLAQVVGTIVLSMLGIFVIALLMAFPVKWLINELITPGVLSCVFGTPAISLWQALGLNVLTGILFRSTTK